MNDKKVIAIFGYYGTGNFGDELMLRNLVDRLSPRNHLIIVAYNIAPLWIEPESIDQIQIVKVDKQDPIFKRMRSIFHILKAVFLSEFVIYGGGTFIFDNVKRSYKNLIGIFRVALLCKLLNKKLGLIGIGIGELTTVQGLYIARFILRNSYLITLRDSISLQKAENFIGKSSRTTYLRSADLAFLDTGHMKTRDSRKEGVDGFLISFCGMEFHYREGVGKTEEGLSNLLALALDKLVKLGITLHFVPMQTSTLRDDNAFHRKIQNKMKYKAHTKLINVQGDYSIIYNELISSDLVIGLRLHSLVTAVCLNTPVLALALSDKVRYFMDDIGLNRFLVQIKDINDPNELYKTINSVIRSIKSGKYPNIAKRIAKQRELAEINITSLEANI